MPLDPTIRDLLDHGAIYEAMSNLQDQIDDLVENGVGGSGSPEPFATFEVTEGMGNQVAVGWSALAGDGYHGSACIEFSDQGNEQFMFRINGGTANLKNAWFFGGVNTTMSTGSLGDGFGTNYATRAPIADEFNLGGGLHVDFDIDARVGRHRALFYRWAVRTDGDGYRVGAGCVWWLDEDTPLTSIEIAVVSGDDKIAPKSVGEIFVVNKTAA